MTSEIRPVFSVVITSRNRVEDLLIAIESALAQVETTLEVLVYDDASSDGSADRVTEAFPEVRLFRHETQQGYIVHRNTGYRDARGDFVVSIDDDAYFSDRHILARVAKCFGKHPQAGAIAMPFIEPYRARGSGMMSDTRFDIRLRGFVGCAHAIRQEAFLDAGGYREFLIHQGEERDFCIRLLETGRDVIYANAPAIVHGVNPSRNLQRLAYFSYRNTLLFWALNAPQPYVVPRMLLSCVQLLAYRFRIAEVPRRLAALAAGFAVSLKYLPQRRPVSRRTYRRFRTLPSHGPLRWDASAPVPLPVTRESACATTAQP